MAKPILIGMLAAFGVAGVLVACFPEPLNIFDQLVGTHLDLKV